MRLVQIVIGFAVVAVIGLGLAQAGARRDAAARAERLQKAEGRSFYQYEADYRCHGFMPDAGGLASWKDRIEVRDGRFVRWGDRCNNQGIGLDAAKAGDSVLSDDLQTLTVAGVVYRHAKDPKAALAGAEAKVQP
ncbi:MAG: hypothetical protein RL490_2140 [Pseudomonadota bacterium]|jgi:hypothetical protein